MYVLNIYEREISNNNSNAAIIKEFKTSKLLTL